jgi:4-hydroxybenzoate polyprenyltransferase
LCVAGLHAYTTIMDITSDKEAGQRTFAIAFGKRTAAAFALLTIVLALVLGDWLPVIVPYCWLCVACYSVVVIKPSERLARWLFLVVAAGFMVTALRVVFALAGIV